MDSQPESKPKPNEQPQPAGYDLEGRPLYYHPPNQAGDSDSGEEQPTGPQYVHFTRPLEPIQQDIPPEVKERHEDSVKRYPGLNLSKGEYVVRAIRRHPIGLVTSVGVALLLILLVGTFMVALPVISGGIGFSEALYMPIMIIGTLLMILFAVGGYIAAWVYVRNEFYLTNESVIQEIQTSLLSRHEQTVSLGNIEDASYQQRGVVQYMFNYGMIRLSTEGDETTYRFQYAANPKEQVAILNNAVEAFKNGRPVALDENR